MRTIALYNLKGGVGKTAAAVNIAHLSALAGNRTLLVDLDPQASASFYFRVVPRKKWTPKQLARGGKRVDKAILASDYPLLDVLPSSMTFRKMSRVMGDMKRSRHRLHDALKELGDQYELIVIDAPPSIDLDAENIFAAADVILVPIIPTTLSLETLQSVESFLVERGVRTDTIHPFFSMVDRRKRLHEETIAGARSARAGVLQTEIPFTSEIERMGVDRAPLTARHRRTRSARAFQGLWQEVSRLLTDGAGGGAGQSVPDSHE
ncbi:MAG: ParA family protein [Spirochaetaceae bacterium]